MDEDIPQLFESIQGQIRTPERALQLVTLLEEAFSIGRPICSKCGEFLGTGPGHHLWDVVIEVIPHSSTIQVVKTVRDHLRMSLRDCVEGVHHLPWTVVEGLPHESAQKLLRNLERVGSKARLRAST